MAGTYTIGEKKTRPGVYHRYENAGGLVVAGAVNGIGAGVIQANWGPLNKAIEFAPETKVNTIFGRGKTEDLITEMFTGGITSGFFVRAGTGGTASKLTLELSAEGTAGTLEGAYVGDRAFTATIRDSLVGGRELIIYEGTTEFLRVSYEAGENEVAALEAAVAAATKDFIFTPEHEATGALKDITQEAFTAGTNPTVSATEYSAAFEALEPFTWNVLCIDTDDVATHLLLDAFLDRIYDAGAYPMACIPAKLDSELEERFTTAKSYNDPKIIYVLNSATNAAGVTYKGYQIAARVGGMAASIASNQSLTHKVVTGMVDLDKPLTGTEITNALKSGCLVLSMNKAGQVQIEQGINTLITPNGEQDDGWKKIRRVKTRFELMQRIDDTIENTVGNVNNDEDGRATIIAGGNNVIKTMFREKKLLDGGQMYEDPGNTPEGDSAWFIIEVDDIDSIEKIYLLYRYRFAPATE